VTFAKYTQYSVGLLGSPSDSVGLPQKRQV